MDGKTAPSMTVDLSPDEKALGYAGLVSTHLLENVEKLLAAALIDTPAWPSRTLAHLDRLSIADHLATQGLSQAAIKLLTLGAFPAAIAARLRGRILLNSPVRAMTQFADRIEIAIEHAGRTTTMGRRCGYLYHPIFNLAQGSVRARAQSDKAAGFHRHCLHQGDEGGVQGVVSGSPTN